MIGGIYIGDRLYIISPIQYNLLTLARDGTLLATYTDPALKWSYGQVLVCGWLSCTVLQLATLATQEDGHHIIHHCGTELLLGRDNDAEDVGDKHDAEDEVAKNGMNLHKVSTSIDIQLAKQQHQSGLQEPNTEPSFPSPDP
ncbi:hypothetical protein DPMN_168617 [Dreissena polymorpha]|uniref:Uncharacterized protein n=1 Tax=Dreissena polymorpha TaxID=45954 RepID=A0A9D4F2A6_DREPO|nr:hypothetical protein DPMN_168617 [Dreissena polymorpha]